jgi:cytochrome c oxidase subunit 2
MPPHGTACAEEAVVVLRFGEPQVAIAIVFGVLAVTIAGAALVIAVHAKEDVPYYDVSRSGYRLRRPWLAFLCGLGVVAVGFSFFLLPYASGGGNDTTVAVSGGQFYWTIDPAVLPAHEQVRFDVTSVDVNHGFGVYDPNGRLIGSVQAMPGYTNELELTFDTVGEYRIRCFEYCGLSHHNMVASFRVEER